MFDFDVAILGAGLHGGLAATALSELRPSPRVLLVEESSAIGGNHVWSCHTTDVGDGRSLFQQLPIIRWPGYDVRFPQLDRRVSLEYCSMHSNDFAAMVGRRVEESGFETRFACQAEIIAPQKISLSDGRQASAEWIIDARGAHRADRPNSNVGWQKFLGLEIECEQPQEANVPCVMDAVSIAQSDGYHFVYTLPFSPTRLLVEDTYYSDDSSIDCDRSRKTILDYVGRRGWKIRSALREERGVLPIPYGQSPEPKVAENPAPTTIGWRGGWFHPTTGYSFGLGVQVAAAVARCWEKSKGRDRAELIQLAARVRRQGGLARRLNRLLFTAFAPENRMHVLERFHRVLSDDSIARFYSMTLTRRDQWNLLVGRPPRGFSGRRWLSHLWQGAGR